MLRAIRSLPAMPKPFQMRTKVCRIHSLAAGVIFLGLCLAALGTPEPRRTSAWVKPAVETGKLDSAELSESSGLIASRQNPGVLWVHNDSGDRARIFAINEKGQLLAEYTLPGAVAVDWEEISFGPGPGTGDYIYVGDNGLNRDGQAHYTKKIKRDEVRAFPAFFRFSEPKVPEGIPPDPAQTPRREVRDWERIELRYPDDKPYNCEAFTIDRTTGDAFLFVKNHVAGDPEKFGRVFLATARQIEIASKTKTPVRLKLAAKVRTNRDSTRPALATAADLSADGKILMVKNIQEVFVWVRHGNENWAERLREEPEAPFHLPIAIGDTFTQPGIGEAIGLTPDSRSFYTLKEGKYVPLWRWEFTDAFWARMAEFH